MNHTIQGLVRHLLTIAGGYLVANGTIGQEEMLVAAGAAASIVGVLWSIFSKSKSKP